MPDDIGDVEPEYGQVWLGQSTAVAADGYLPIIGPVNTIATATFPAKVTIGDYTKDAEDYLSSLILSDLTGGMNVEDMNEGSDTTRAWTIFADSRKPGKIALNPLVRQKQPTGASGTCYPLGAINDTAYLIFGTKIYGYNEATSDFYTGVGTLTLTPRGKAVAYAGKIYVPCGATGYIIVSEVSTGVPTFTEVVDGVAQPAAFNSAIKNTATGDSVLPVAFAVFEQRLWSLSTSGTLAWSFLGGQDQWEWPHDEARGWFPHIQSGETPKRIISFYNPTGEPELYITTDRGIYRYAWAIPAIIDTPARFPPHPDNGGACAVWRPGEDLHVGVGVDEWTLTTANVVVPMKGLARDDGVPQELRGRVVDLEPEISELYALVGPAATSTPGFAYSAKVGAAGVGNGQFDDVRGLVVSGTSVWACDENNERLQKFTAGLAYSSQFGGSTGTGNGAFASNNGPYDVCLDNNSNLVVVDRGNHRVQVFNSSGAYQSQFPLWRYQATYGPTFNALALSTPQQVAVTSTGKIYVADKANNRLVRLTSLGVYDASITGLTKIVGVCVDASDNVYVSFQSGSGNTHLGIKKYNSAHTVQWTDDLGTGTAGHVATDSTTLFVVDTKNNKVYRRNCSNSAAATGNATFGAAGSDDGQFSAPTGAIANATHVYLVDTGNSRMSKWTVAGAYVTAWGLNDGNAQGVAADGSGNLWVAGATNKELYRYSITGTLQVSIPLASAPAGIGVASGDVLWVSDTGANTLLTWDETANTVASAIPGQLSSPESVAFSSASHNTYVLDVGNSRVQYFNSTGAYVGGWGSVGTDTGQFTTPTSIRIHQADSSSDEAVYVLDAGNKRVQQFTGTGVFVRSWGSAGTGDGQFSTPTILAVHPGNGRVYVGDSGRGDIQVFSGAGSYITKIGAAGSGNGQFTAISGLALSADGNDLYVADLTLERITRFASGATSVAATLPWLAANTQIGWYGRWRGSTLGVTPTTAAVTATSAAYRLWWGCDDGYAYTCKLHRYFENPRQALLSGENEFEATGEIVTGRFDAAMLGFDKIGSHLVVMMDHATATEYLTIEYRADVDGGWTLLGTVTTTTKTYLPLGITSAMPDGAGVPFNWIQFRLRFYRGSDVTQTPILKAIVFPYLKIPENSDAFNFVVAFPRDGYLGRSASALRDYITALITSRTLFYLKPWPNDSDQVFRGYLTAASGLDQTEALVGGQRIVNFISIKSTA